MPKEGNRIHFERYGVADTATYVFRPDGLGDYNRVLRAVERAKQK